MVSALYPRDWANMNGWAKSLTLIQVQSKMESTASGKYLSWPQHIMLGLKLFPWRRANLKIHSVMFPE